MEGVKVKSRFFCFIRADLTMTPFLWSRSTKKNPKYAPAKQITPFKKINPFVNTKMFTEPNHKLLEMLYLNISSIHFTVAGYDIPIGLSWSNMS